MKRGWFDLLKGKDMKLLRAVSLITVLVGTLCFSQQATVKHNVNLRGDPSTNNPPITLLHPGNVVQLIDTDKTAGYYHVHTSDGTEGWVWARNVTAETSNPGGGGSETP